MTFKITAYESTIESVVKNLSQVLSNFQLTSKELQVAKDHLTSEISHSKSIFPNIVAFTSFFKTVLKDFVDSDHIIITSSKINLEEFNETYKRLISNAFLRAFVHGTLPEDKTQKMLHHFVHLIRPNALSIQNIHYLNEHADLRGFHILAEQLVNEKNHSHATLNFFQVGQETLDNVFKTKLIARIAGGLIFVRLRTEKQLGYSCKLKIMADQNVLYVMLSVVGSRQKPNKTDIDMDGVIKEIREKVEKIDLREFKKMNEETIKELKKNDGSFKNRTIRSKLTFSWSLIFGNKPANVFID